MKKYLSLLALIGVFTLPMAPSAMAEEEKSGGFFKQRYERFQNWRNASDEEKKEIRDERKAKIEERHDKWQSMTDEEKAAAKEKRQERHQARKAKAQEKYNGLSDERKAQVDARRDKVQARRQNVREKRRDYWNSLND